MTKHQMKSTHTRKPSRRTFLHQAASGIAAAAVASNPLQAQERKAPKHIIIVIADDLGWPETGYNGHKLLQTPVLDEMAANGLRFDRFYAGAAMCTPTRGSVMTGRNANRFGAFAPNMSIRPEEITLPQLMRDKGYITGLFGKWHLGPSKADAPTNPGMMGFRDWLSHDNFFGHSPKLSRNGAMPQRFHGESSEVVAREAARFIEQGARSERSTFTVLSFGSPHEPYTPADDDIVPYHGKVPERLAERFAEITAMDRAIGHLRDTLKRIRIQDDTLLWFISDNGTPVPDAVDSPLRGAKGSYYEGGIRVPSIIEWKGGISEARRTSVPAVTSDMLPTLCEIAGIPMPQRQLDGISLVPLLDGVMQQRPSPICFWVYDVAREARENPGQYLSEEAQTGNIPTSKVPFIVFRNHKHPKARTSDFGGTAAITDNRYKLYVPPKGAPELYDLEADTAEKLNLAGKQPDRVREMLAKLHEWQRSVERSLTGADYGS
ncbi:MAG: sulfatase-like hydrolase/transferase [Bryobacterales bacterium]|nr:sulfatase-like hydrolase/transferase [Bryobacterales bacterium]